MNFDPKVQDHKSNLTRDLTPYPKELHIKALQWRAAREDAGAVLPDRAGINSEVTLRSNGRTKSLHRPYSLIRALSDPIEQDLTSPTHSRPGSRKRDHSRERREASRSPCQSYNSQLAPFVRGGSDRRGDGPTSGSFNPSPSPPPLAQPLCTPEHQRGGKVELPTNVAQVHEKSSMTASPLRISPSDDYRAALLANSNSNNGNYRPAVPVTVSVKSSTFPLTSSAWCPQMPLQSSGQGQSETSTLSHSDAPNPRFSSSVESGFDADMEQDPTSHWYMTDTLQKLKEHSRRRYASDSSSRPYVPAGTHRQRSGSADDYDHLYLSGAPDRKAYHKYSHSSSPLTNGGSHIHPHLFGHHQKSSRSFDNTEPYMGGHYQKTDVTMDAQLVQRKHRTSNYTGSHSRSQSPAQPEDLVNSVPTTTHRSTEGSQSPSHLSSDFVKAPQSPHQLEEGREYRTRPLVSEVGTRPMSPGQRVTLSPSPVPVLPSVKSRHHYQNVSYCSSDDSKSPCAEPSTQPTPKVCMYTYMYFHPCIYLLKGGHLNKQGSLIPMLVYWNQDTFNIHVSQNRQTPWPCPTQGRAVHKMT